MGSPHSHLLEVEMRFSASGEGVELVMPAWTPGSYLLREFARNVQDFEATGGEGRTLAWTKLDKGTWRIDAPAGEEVRVRYRVYANELTVRTSHLDATHAFVSPASVFMFVRGREIEPLHLEVAPPEGWRVATALRSPEALRFEAANYDELVDSPLEIGVHRRVEWEQDGIPHAFAIWGRGGYDPERLVADTRRIIDVAAGLFGGLPYDRYLFILHLFPGGRGGLEHKASCALQAERWAFEGEAYDQLLGLIAHEFFHVWNAKRIRPAALGPFDYTSENYTRDLWVVEGLTTYYTDLIVRRAGLLSEEKYLARLADMIERLEKSPGRLHQSLAESSFDTWIRFYRPDENSGNSQISYYHKGALVGLLLDLEIRRATQGRRSLDDVMHLLWERYGRADIGYPEGSVQDVAEEVAGVDLSAFFAAYVRGVEELDYEQALTAVGLELKKEPGRVPAERADAGASEAGGGMGGTEKVPDVARVEARLGVRMREEGGRLTVASVRADGPGRAAGLDARDEILALDGLRVGGVAEMAARLGGMAEGARVDVALFRRDELLRVEVAVGPEATGKWRLVPVEGASAELVELREGWLAEMAGEAPRN
jgi:predicted metalloprotease with PDZ domain